MSRAVVLIVLAVAVGLAGCVTSSAAAGSEDRPGEPRGLGEPPVPPPATRPAQPEVAPLAPDHLQVHDSRTIPGGLACLIRLRELEIPFVSLPPLKGVLTPVKVTGPVGGIRYVPLGARAPLVGDCRLVLALHRAARYLQNLGVTELHYSGAYRYSLMPSGRLSQHAMGLAIDVHKVRAGGELLDIRNDFSLGLEDGCKVESPLLNRMACLLRVWRLFDWVLTPDFDRSHDNHFHLDIYCLYRRRYLPKDAPELANDD